MKITANKIDFTFTIEKDGTKYITSTMSREEFEDCEYNTESDWKDFLKSSGSYYKI